MSDASPEMLLKSALEKIVYFEARSNQLSNETAQAKAEIEKLRLDLAQASHREIELRRVIAELEVRAVRAHGEREDTARLNEVLKRERTELIGKMLEASRLHGVGEHAEPLDLAQFIAQLREEVGALKGERPVAKLVLPVQVPPEANAAPTQMALQDQTITQVAQSWKDEGRIGVTASDTAHLSGTTIFQGRTDETLFGFSVRELSSPDAGSRLRAAERLKALGHSAASPAVAAALHAETDGNVQVALLNAISSLAKIEAVPVVAPLLTSHLPEVRVAALKALLTLDPKQAGPHLTAAMKDPSRAVRRRASLLALGLTGTEALALGADAIRDTDADVRAVAALVLGASGAEQAKHVLFGAMRDPDERVRKAASQAVSRLLGRDVTNVVDLDAAERRREVRRLTTVPSNPVRMSTAPAPTAVATAGKRVAVLEVVKEAPPAPVSEAMLESVMGELRAAIRGKTLETLVSDTNSSAPEMLRACTALIERGQVVRRGHKYFVS